MIASDVLPPAEPSAPVRAALAAIPGVERNGVGWVGRCPRCRADGMTVRQARDGWALLACRTGFSPAQIRQAMGLAPAALFSGATPAQPAPVRPLHREELVAEDAAIGRAPTSPRCARSWRAPSGGARDAGDASSCRCPSGRRWRSSATAAASAT